MTGMSMVQALNQALCDEMAADPRVVVLGQDVGRLGGVFRVTDGLQDRFGEERCIDTPLAESAIVGSSIGLAMAGWRPVAEIQFDGFSYPAFEQMISHLAKLRSRSRGRLSMPVTVRVPYGGGIGAVEQHSESPEAYWAHTAGLTVVTPATADDAYAMLRWAVRSDDPVIFLEPKRLYWSSGEVDLAAGAAAGAGGPRPVVRRIGRDVTLVAYGPSIDRAMTAADAATGFGVDVEVVDLRTIAPLDLDLVVGSVTKTGPCVVVHEASRSFGVGAEIAAAVTEATFSTLEAPVLRATGFDTPYPPAAIERSWLPGVERILDVVEQALDYQ